VRINSSDLPKALAIIEDVDLSYYETSSGEEVEEDNHKISKEILVPVDFSVPSMKACEFAFRLANDLHCHIKLMHAYFSPYYPMAIPFGDTFAIQAPDEELYKNIHKKVEAQMQEWTKTLQNKIQAGLLTDIHYSTLIVEGLPEEEIINYSRKAKPIAIVMGTRGSSERDLDLIGSVTAEVIEGSRTPIFAIPDDAPDKHLSEMNKIAFLTNFREREFVAFERLMKLIGDRKIEIYILHISKKDDLWNEIKLSGMKNYLKEKYPLLEIHYKLLDSANDRLEVAIDNFVKENQIDMISMSSSRRNIFARMFNPGLARRVIFHSKTPLLVLKN
jgi:nucleotide-binding universal stress UspA family protein